MQMTHPAALRRLVVLLSGVARIAQAVSLPTWQALASKVPSAAAARPITTDWLIGPQASFSDERPTLFRERNGWCPYSARVWLALEYKGVDYETVKVDAGRFDGRPAGLSGATPQLRWPDGTLMEGSIDIIEALDVWQPANPLCRPANVAWTEVQELTRACESTFPGVQLKDGEPLRLRGMASAFEEAMEFTDQLLCRHLNGPFFCGTQLSIVDVVWAPFLERYEAWLPLTFPGLCIRDASRWPHLCRWFEAMEAQPIWACHLRGDGASWSKVLASSPGWLVLPTRACSPPRRSADAMRGRAEATAVLWQAYAAGRPYVASTPQIELAAHFLRNHQLLVTDITAATGAAPERADAHLRALAWLLTSPDGDAGPSQDMLSMLVSPSVPSMPQESLRATAEYLEERVCVPRDVCAPAATALSRLTSQILQCYFTV